MTNPQDAVRKMLADSVNDLEAIRLSALHDASELRQVRASMLRRVAERRRGPSSPLNTTLNTSALTFAKTLRRAEKLAPEARP